MSQLVVVHWLTSTSLPVLLTSMAIAKQCCFKNTFGLVISKKDLLKFWGTWLFY